MPDRRTPQRAASAGAGVAAIAVLISGCGPGSTTPTPEPMPGPSWVVKSIVYTRNTDRHYAICIDLDHPDDPDRWREITITRDQAYDLDTGDPCPTGAAATAPTPAAEVPRG